MTTPHKTDNETQHGRSTAKQASGSHSTNVIELLEADHKKVKKLFKEFGKATEESSPAAKIEIAHQICAELTVHTQVEEEIFYPAAYSALKDSKPELIDEALVEHATAKDLVRQIRSMDGSEALYDAKIKVLSEYIDHHVDEEENQLFPKIRHTDLDLEAIGSQIDRRKEELQSKTEKTATHKR